MDSVNVFIRLVIKPKETIRWIIDNDPNYGVMLIGMMVGITSALKSSIIHGLHPLPGLIGFNALLDDIIAYGIGPSASIVMTIATITVYGAVFGIVSLLVGSLFVSIVSYALGAKVVQYLNVRASLAWAFMPYGWLLPVWIVYAIVYAELLRMQGFVYGPVAPWEITIPLKAMFYFDYAVRFFCTCWMVLKLSEAIGVTVLKSALIVFFSFLPVMLLLIPWQGLGF